MSEDLRELTIEVDGKEHELYIEKPSAKDIEQSQFEKAKAFKRGLENNLYLKKEMDKVLRDRGVWDDELEDEIKTLTEELGEKINSLSEGGIKLSEARDLAISINKLRNKIASKTRVRQDFSNITADGMSQQAELDYLVSSCTVYKNNRKKNYFQNYSDYLDRKNDVDAFVIAQRYAEIMYDAIFDEKRFPENEFFN